MTAKNWERGVWKTPAPAPDSQQHPRREDEKGVATSRTADLGQSNPIVKLPMIVVRREFYDAFVNGSKTTEYRRNKRPFTTETFYTGRTIRLAYNYNLNRFPSRLARITDVNILRAGSLDRYTSLQRSYPDLTPEDEIICIGLDLLPPSASSPGSPIGLVTTPNPAPPQPTTGLRKKPRQA